MRLLVKIVFNDYHCLLPLYERPCRYCEICCYKQSNRGSGNEFMSLQLIHENHAKLTPNTFMPKMVINCNRLLVNSYLKVLTISLVTLYFDSNYFDYRCL